MCGINGRVQVLQCDRFGFLTRLGTIYLKLSKYVFSVIKMCVAEPAPQVVCCLRANSRYSVRLRFFLQCISLLLKCIVPT